MPFIDYSESLSQIINVINTQNLVIQELKSNIDIFNFLIISSIAIILGILFVKD